MSLSIEQIEMLVNLGASPQDILAFARTNGKGPRSKAAERTARWRERKAVNVTENVTRDGHSDASPPPNDNSNPPINPISNEIVSKPRRKSVGDGMPEGWEPVLTPAAQRVVDGWPPGMFERTLSGFRNHAADKGRKSKDWQAAFRTWIDNADKWKPKNDNPASNDELQNPYVRAVARREADRAGIGF